MLAELTDPNYVESARETFENIIYYGSWAVAASTPVMLLAVFAMFRDEIGYSVDNFISRFQKNRTERPSCFNGLDNTVNQKH